MTIAVSHQKSDMDSRFAGMSATELRSRIVDETQKFILALQFSSPLSDLEQIREQIRLLTDALAVKEKDESKIVEKHPQSTSSNQL